MRDHERRRDDGADSGPDSVLPGARADDSYCGGTDPLPAAQRAVYCAGGRDADPDQVWRVIVSLAARGFLGYRI